MIAVEKGEGYKKDILTWEKKEGNKKEEDKRKEES